MIRIHPKTPRLLRPAAQRAGGVLGQRCPRRSARRRLWHFYPAALPANLARTFWLRKRALGWIPGDGLICRLGGCQEADRRNTDEREASEKGEF